MVRRKYPEVLRGSGKPDEQIRAMGKNVGEIYNQGERACLLAMLSIGESHHLFYTQIQQVLNAWIDALAQVLVEAGLQKGEARLWAEDAILQIRGALVLARGLNDTTPFQRVLQRLPKDLLKP